MNLDDINNWILGHSQNYPGNTKNYCIVQATCGKSSIFYSHQANSENIKEKILNGNSVNMKELGASTMEVNSDYVKPLQHSGFNMAQDLPIQRAERKHAHQIRSSHVLFLKILLNIFWLVILERKKQQSL